MCRSSDEGDLEMARMDAHAPESTQKPQEAELVSAQPISSDADMVMKDMARQRNVWI